MEKDTPTYVGPLVKCENCGHDNIIPDSALNNANLGYSPGEDRVLSCVECNDDFAWNSGEQLFYFDRGLAQPLRCQVCRAKRNQRVNKLKKEGLTSGVEEGENSEATSSSPAEQEEQAQ